jgi:hypothetical protein
VPGARLVAGRVHEPEVDDDRVVALRDHTVELDLEARIRLGAAGSVCLCRLQASERAGVDGELHVLVEVLPPRLEVTLVERAQVTLDDRTEDGHRGQP